MSLIRRRPAALSLATLAALALAASGCAVDGGDTRAALQSAEDRLAQAEEPFHHFLANQILRHFGVELAVEPLHQTADLGALQGLAADQGRVRMDLVNKLGNDLAAGDGRADVLVLGAGLLLELAVLLLPVSRVAGTSLSSRRGPPHPRTSW